MSGYLAIYPEEVPEVSGPIPQSRYYTSHHRRVRGLLEGGDDCLRPSRSIHRSTDRSTADFNISSISPKAPRPVPLRPIKSHQSPRFSHTLPNAPPQATAAPRPSFGATRRQPPDPPSTRSLSSTNFS